MKSSSESKNGKPKKVRKPANIKSPANADSLGELAATAICGNDINSSCLYVSALSIVYAGRYAWIALLMVAGVLFYFEKFMPKWLVRYRSMVVLTTHSSIPPVNL